MNHLKVYRENIVGKSIIGLGEDRVIFDTGEWWALAVPFKDNRLNYVGKKITSIRVIDNNLELIINKEQKLYLHWRDENDTITGPKFPEKGKIRAWELKDEDIFWKKFDQLCRIRERILS